MPIRVVCKHCGKQFSAWDDLIGQAVKCPKCQQQMVVHAGNDVLGDAPTAPPPAPRPAPAPPAPRPSSSPMPTPGAAPPMPTAPAGPNRPIAAGSDPDATDDFDDSEDLPYACPHCHQSMPADEDLCDHCGYHRILKRRIDIGEGIKKREKAVGFERFFKDQLADANSAGSTLLMIKVVGGLLAAALLFVCHPWSWLVAIAVGIGYYVYRSKQRPSTTVHDDPSSTNQDAASALLWTLALAFQRAVGWRLLAWPFPTTRSLTLHDPTFTDQDLSEVEDLSQYQTLDLEGTQLSDAGLQQLEPIKGLRYIVVRRTSVTVAGVQRLQQALPQASIWY